MKAEPTLEVIEDEVVLALGDEVLALCHAVFAEFAPAYLLDRLPRIDGRALVVARDEARRMIGFKLGYRRSGAMFYSWLGGVHPDARGRGLAGRLMAIQHTWARSKGYAEIETRTRAENRVMIIANLKGGFRITGFEIHAGYPVVIQHVDLGRGPATVEPSIARRADDAPRE
jgi:GNAT superfamily N-acetyltransferase